MSNKPLSYKDFPEHVWEQIRAYIFDANVYMMLGHDPEFIAGERAYKKAMSILKENKIDTTPYQPEAANGDKD